VAAWVYRYGNEVPLPIPTITTGAIEIAVQLAGAWQVSRWPHEPHGVDAGDVFVLPKGVRHTYAFQATAPVHGLQVGFAVDPQLFNSDRWCMCSTTRVPATTAQRFRELAHAVLDEDGGVDDAGVAGAVVQATKALFDEVWSWSTRWIARCISLISPTAWAFTQRRSRAALSTRWASRRCAIAPSSGCSARFSCCGSTPS
jgi:hypothetical protein